MTTFSDLLCECSSCEFSCEFYRNNLTPKQLATVIPKPESDIRLKVFEKEILSYRTKFQVSTLEIPVSILQTIFDKPFNQDKDYT